MEMTRKSNLSVSSLRKSVNKSSSTPDLHVPASLPKLRRDKEVEDEGIDRLSDQVAKFL